MINIHDHDARASAAPHSTRGPDPPACGSALERGPAPRGRARRRVRHLCANDEPALAHPAGGGNRRRRASIRRCADEGLLVAAGVDHGPAGLARRAAGRGRRAARIVQAARRRTERSMSDGRSRSSTVEVAADPLTAFTAFTDELDLWWVRGPINAYDTGRLVEMRCEPGVGGRILEVYDDASGDALELARLTVWEPGKRLAWKSSLDDVTIDGASSRPPTARSSGSRR